MLETRWIKIADLLALCEKAGNLPPFAREARSALLNLILPPLCLQ